MRVEQENMLKQRDYVFLKVDALELWKIKSKKKIYGDTKKLLRLKNIGKLASSKPNFQAAEKKKVNKMKI